MLTVYTCIILCDTHYKYSIVKFSCYMWHSSAGLRDCKHGLLLPYCSTAAGSHLSIHQCCRYTLTSLPTAHQYMACTWCFFANSTEECVYNCQVSTIGNNCSAPSNVSSRGSTLATVTFRYCETQSTATTTTSSSGQHRRQETACKCSTPLTPPPTNTVSCLYPSTSV